MELDRYSDAYDEHLTRTRDLINRFSDLIKKKFSLIPDPDEFVTWLMDERRFRSNKRVEIEELFEYAYLYSLEIEGRINQINGTSTGRIQTNSYIDNELRWLGTDSQLRLLFHELLENGFISLNTPYSNFSAIFKEPASKKIEWVKFNIQNKKEINKKSLHDLFSVLIREKYIPDSTNVIQVINSHFARPGNVDMNFTHANKSGFKPHSTFIRVLDQIVDSLANS